MKSLKTPLRYPGGKSRALTKLLKYLPTMEIEEYREPFLGGGSVAIEMTKRLPKDVPIWVNDLYEPLYNFWCVLRDNGQSLQSELTKIKNQHPDRTTAQQLFTEAKVIVNDREKTNLERAVSFYIVNKCSFSGLTESSSFSPQASDNNFTMRGIEKLTGYSEIIKDWKITNLSYEQLCSDTQKVFIYADPPYDIKDVLYGNKGSMHKGFDHSRFADEMDKCLCNVMISYNDHPDIIERFLEWCQYDYEHTYTMRSTGTYMSDQKQRRELILTNYGKFRGACTP